MKMLIASLLQEIVAMLSAVAVRCCGLGDAMAKKLDFMQTNDLFPSSRPSIIVAHKY